MRAIRACVQMPRPDDSVIITRVCPHCRAMNGQRCRTASKAQSDDFHMARILDALGYGRIRGTKALRSVYAWRTGPFAKELAR